VLERVFRRACQEACAVCLDALEGSEVPAVLSLGTSEQSCVVKKGAAEREGVWLEN